MIRKTYDGVYFKALNDETGEFEAVVSVFGNVDLQGDRTMPGAFSKSLDNWKASGDPIPVIWSHDWGDPFAHIGYVSPEDAYEVVNEDAKAAGSGIMGGLFVKGHLDVDKPFAKQVYDLLKERRVREWSFAYDVIDEERNQKDHANELNEVALFEVGPTLKGANSATTTLGVKSILDHAAKENVAYMRFKNWLDVDSEVAHKLLNDLNDETLKPETEDPEDADEKANRGALLDHLELGHGLNRESIVNESQADLKVTHGELHPESEGGGPGKSLEAQDHPDADLEKWYDEVYEKAEFKPWHVEKQGDQYCCIKDSDGSTVDCHDTSGEAQAHIRALYANAEDAGKSAEPTQDKAGRAISKETEDRLRRMRDDIDEILSSVAPADEEKSATAEVDAQLKAEEEAEAEKAKAELEEYKRKLDLLGL